MCPGIRSYYRFIAILLLLSVIVPAPLACKAFDVPVIRTSPAKLEVSLKTASSLPLTPLVVIVKRLSPQTAVNVTFSNSSGYSVTNKALSVGQDGAILVGVPLYVDPITHQITAGSVDVVVSQLRSDGSLVRQSKPVPFRIEDLPTLTGMPLGKVTHSFLTASALLSQRYIMALEFLENASNGQIDISTEINSEADILRSIISARNDVDTIIADPTHVIDIGVTRDGTAIQFTRDSLDIMDRTIAIWLSEIPFNSSPASSAPIKPILLLSTEIKLARSVSVKPVSLRVDKYTNPKNPSLDIDVDMLDDFCGKIDSLIGLADVANQIQSEPSNAQAKGISVLEGLYYSADYFEWPGSTAIGVFSSVATTGKTFDSITNRITTGIQDTATCLMQECNQLPDWDAILESTARQSVSALAVAGLTNLEFVYPDANLGTGIGGLAFTLLEKMASDEDAQTGRRIAQYNDYFNYGGYLMTGRLEETRTRSGLDMIKMSLVPFANAPTPMTMLTDADGNYAFMVPADANGNFASNITIVASDPITGVRYGSEVVDLRDVDVRRPIVVPTMRITKAQPPEPQPPQPQPPQPPQPPDPSGYNLDIRTLPYGGGSVTVTPEKTRYNSGDSITLTVTVNEGWTFAGWACSGIAIPNRQDTTIHLTMPAGNAIVEAQFVPGID